jgi:hypothetical protein
MPISGKTLAACAQTFRDTLAPVIGLLPNQSGTHFAVEYTDQVAVLRFRPGAWASYVVDDSRIWLLLRQTVFAEKQPTGDVELRTQNYRYCVHETHKSVEEPPQQPLDRFEYVKFPEGPYPYCRNHYHYDPPESLEGKLHRPTGWVSIESVVRYVIADRKVPPTAANWEEVLTASERQMRTEFFPKLGAAPDPVATALRAVKQLTPDELKQFRQRAAHMKLI